MGASQAVLESVIFVHQDESNWPLDDAKTVKKKFDAIFNLAGYTKAGKKTKSLPMIVVSFLSLSTALLVCIRSFRIQTLKQARCWLILDCACVCV